MICFGLEKHAQTVVIYRTISNTWENLCKLLTWFFDWKLYISTAHTLWY